MVKVGKVVNTVQDYVQDGAAIIVSGVAVGTLKELGGILAIWLSPKIAKTSGGKTFNRYFALVLTVDAFLERFTPKGVI